MSTGDYPPYPPYIMCPSCLGYHRMEEKCGKCYPDKSMDLDSYISAKDGTFNTVLTDSDIRALVTDGMIIKNGGRIRYKGEKARALKLIEKKVYIKELEDLLEGDDI